MQLSETIHYLQPLDLESSSPRQHSLGLISVFPNSACPPSNWKILLWSLYIVHILLEIHPFSLKSRPHLRCKFDNVVRAPLDGLICPEREVGGSSLPHWGIGPLLVVIRCTTSVQPVCS